MIGFSYTARRVSQRIRTEYVAAILRQNIAFFDEIGIGAIVEHLSSSITTIQDGLTDKVAFTISLISTLIAAFVVALVSNWKFTLALTSTIIVLIAMSAVLIKITLGYRLATLQASATVSSVVEDFVSSISSITSSNSQKKVLQVYEKQLAIWNKWEFNMRTTYSLIVSTTSSILLFNYVCII
jgi:ATP-binding cassette, subfamily B (MDR/TAP), member 1